MRIFDKNFRKILTLALRHKKTLAIALVLTLFQSAAQPVAIWLISEVITLLTNHGSSFGHIISLVALSVAITSAGLILYNISYLHTERLGLKIYHDLFIQSYDRVVNSNISGDQEKDYKTAFASAKGWLEDVVYYIISFITSGVLKLIIAAAIILFNFGWKYFLILLFFVLVPVVFYIPFSKKMLNTHTQSNETNLKINRNLSEIVENLPLISSYQTRQFEKRRALSGFDDYAKSQMSVAKGYIQFDGFRSAFNAVILFALLTVVIRDVMDGKIGVGQIFLFYSYIEIFIAQFSSLPSVYLQMQRQIKRLEPLLDTDKLTPISDDEPPLVYPQIDALIVSNFRSDYLPDLDETARYHFEIGQIYWLRGENGAGKSTFLRAVMAAERAAHVDVAIETPKGTLALKPQDRARNFAYAAQEPQIWDRSVRDNLEYAKHGDFGSDIPADFADDLKGEPAFAKIDMDKDAESLSGGQTQLVHIYRALGKNAPVLLLDEPTNALDGEVILELIRSLQNRVPHAIIIMATHSEFLQKIATREVEIVKR